MHTRPPVTLALGSRWRSATCATEVIVTRTAAEPVDLRCGGVPMLPAADAPAAPTAALEPGMATGTLVGKRYELGDLQLLCTKGGDGALSVGLQPLTPVQPKHLPASD